MVDVVLKWKTCNAINGVIALFIRLGNKRTNTDVPYMYTTFTLN